MCSLALANGRRSYRLGAGSWRADADLASQASVIARPARIDSEPYIKLLERIDQEYPADERGDMLIFLSGMSEISYLLDELRLYAAHSKCVRRPAARPGPSWTVADEVVHPCPQPWPIATQALDYFAVAQRPLRRRAGQGV